MALFKSGNPALTNNTFTNIGGISDRAMTLQGTVNKTLILLLIVILSASYTWNLFLSTYNADVISPYLLIGSLGGLITAIIIIINKKLAPYLTPIYSILEGLALGGLSAIMEHRFPGIVLQSILLTFGILFVLLIIYKLRIIKATENFKLIVSSATFGVMLYYLFSLTLSFWDIKLPLIHESSTGGIIFSLFVVILASANLVVDFDFIEQGVDNGAPKYMEWYGAFGLMVTIIWLYLEILRLLGKSRRR